MSNTKEYYIKEYIQNNKTITQIASELDCHPSTISRRMEKLNIPRNKRSGKGRYNWKGENVSYRELHKWVNKNKEKPEECVICNTNKKLEVANISGEYKRNLDDYIYVCRSCHRLLDKLWGRRL